MFFQNPQIAEANYTTAGASSGDVLPNASGCKVIAGVTGTAQVTLDDLSLTDEDLIVLHNPGFGSSKAGGGLTTTLSALSSGVFLVSVWDQTVVPPVLIDGPVHLMVFRRR